jgi:hypothetical protein
MLAERAPTEHKRQIVSRRLRTCFSVGFVALFLLSWVLGPAVAGRSRQHQLSNHAAAVSQVSAAVEEGSSQQLLTSPTSEASELYPPTTLRFDADGSTIILWQPKELASSRIIPQGLVLSFLCDSARHQCSGVLLA